jgi:hypothetical protein
MMPTIKVENQPGPVRNMRKVLFVKPKISPTGPLSPFRPATESTAPSTTHRAVIPARASAAAVMYPQSSSISSASTLFNKTAQPTYRLARLANDGVPPTWRISPGVDSGQITSSNGNSFVHEETSRAVETAEGKARPGPTVRLEFVSEIGSVL